MRHINVFPKSIGGLVAASVACMLLLSIFAPNSQAKDYSTSTWYWGNNGGNGDFNQRYWAENHDEAGTDNLTEADNALVTLDNTVEIQSDWIFDAPKALNNIRVGGATGSPTIKQTTGTVGDAHHGYLSLGNVRDRDLDSPDDAYAKYEFTGGEMNRSNMFALPTNGSGSTTIDFVFGSSNDQDTPTLNVKGNLSDGELSLGLAGDQPNYSTSELSGHGTIEAGEFRLAESNPDGTVVWEVEGGNLTLNFDASFSDTGDGTGDFGVDADAGTTAGAYTLRYKLDGTGVSTMNFTGDVAIGSSGGNNETVFDLQTVSGYTHSPGTTYTIISTDGTFTNQAQFKGLNDGDPISTSAGEFIANYDNPTDSTSTFSITAVPEPSSLMLLGLAGLLLMNRRRRQ